MRANSLTLVAVVLAAIAAPLALGAQDEETAATTVKTFKGKVTFRIYCSNCHGDTGRGDGSLAEMLSESPTDLTTLAHNNGGVFPADLVAALVDGREEPRGHGSLLSKEMPVWGDAFQKSLQPSWTEETDENRVLRKVEEVVAFVESIQELGPPASP